MKRVHRHETEGKRVKLWIRLYSGADFIDLDMG
jgi:hypothetical protein